VNTSEPTVPPNSGLINVADIIVAPNAAFARLRIVPTWGWAFLVASLLGIAGALLAEPAIAHAWDQYGPPQLAVQFQNVDAAQRSKMIAQATQASHLVFQFVWISVPIGLLIASLLQALVMMVANAIVHGEGTFSRFYALAMNVGVVGIGLSWFLIGIIAVVRGPGAYATQTAVSGSVPGLALLAPGAGLKLATFLSALNVTAIWSIALLALGMMTIARLSSAAAWTTAIIMLVLSSVIPAAFAR
jgi:hypothetical protein